MSLHAGKADGSRKQSCIRQFEISNYIKLKLCSCLRQDFPSNEGDRGDKPFIPGLVWQWLLNGALLSVMLSDMRAAKGDGLFLSQVPEYNLGMKTREVPRSLGSHQP